MRKLRSFIIGMHWLISNQLGINFKRLCKVLTKIPRYAADYKKFIKEYNGEIIFQPCLLDSEKQSGSINDEYFWQDLYVANKIYANNPEKHVDIGSRIDGFVAHVATYRRIEVFDIRPIHVNIHNVKFTQADLMNLDEQLVNYCDSLSCLHTIEHFGLGRYGDRVDPTGHLLGLSNISKIVKPGGVLYLSVPIGKPRVYFNAHRIIDPQEVVSFMNGLFSLKSLAFVDPLRGFQESASFENDLLDKKLQNYSLAIFEFIKLEN